MYRKLLIALVALALASFGLAACGGDDDEETTDAATTAEETTPADTGGGAGGTVTFTADPGGALAFEETSAETTAGPVTVELVNDSSVPHNVEIEGPDGDVGGTETITGDTTTAAVELEPGDYTFYCSVPGHQEAGMEGALTVE